MVRLEDRPIDPGAMLTDFAQAADGCGAVVCFTGLVRGRGAEREAIETLTLEAHPRFTPKVLAALEAETRARFEVADILVAHRHGQLSAGEPIVFVAVAAAHRRSAFEAADYLMDQLKTRAPFWKREDGPAGRRWIEARPEDHADALRWSA